MREILFRGKDIDNGIFVTGYLIGNDTGKKYITLVGSHCKEVIPETVGQYTGLTDKDGKKIFEGDIVKYGDTINKVVFEQRNGTAYFGVVMDDTETWSFCHLTSAEGMKVIGNIHDNPELLKGE